MGSLPKTKKKLPKSVNEMSKEMLEETIKKKKKLNAKALEIVVKMCEINVEEEWFLNNLQHINQCHYDDITVERAISKLCGYPLCSETIEKIPTQQYHISTRYNKVFDISERKNFCSNICYKSSMYVKNQLFTSPLWFRDQEIIPKYKILKSSKSSLGEEVKFFPDKIKPEPEDIKRGNKKTREEKSEENIKELEEQCKKLLISESEGNDKKKEIVEVQRKPTEIQKDEINIKEKDTSINIIIKERNPGKTEKKYEALKTESLKPNPKPVNLISKVEQAIFEWFTIDTLFFIYEDDKIKELFTDKAIELKEMLNLKLKMASHNEKIDRMIQLYGLLDPDSLIRKNETMNLKPLPDYSFLKEEGKSLEIKVKAFYQGQLEMKQPLKEKVKKEDASTDEKEEEGEKETIYLPLVDSHNLIALRRNIVWNKLNRDPFDLVQMLNSDYTLQRSDVRNLISTFSLSANNITFRPHEWYFIGIIILKLLSLKDKQLESVLNTELAQNHFKTTLKNFGLEKDYLDSLATRLTHSTNIMQKLSEDNK